MGPGPGPGRLGQRLGYQRRAGAGGAERRAHRGNTDAVWPPEVSVAPRTAPAVGPAPAAGPPAPAAGPAAAAGPPAPAVGPAPAGPPAPAVGPPAPAASPAPAADPAGSSRAPPGRLSRPEPQPLGVPASPARRAVQMAGCEEVSVSGFEEFSRAVEQHHGKTIFAYFTGSKDAGGRSWCPDCVQAEPVVREGLKHISEGCVFIYCQVGERPYWKDPNNDFRKNLKVTAVPTLLKYGTPQKLVESECLQANLVEMLFSED
uniref:Thioredoxin domain-containing protein 17 n=1 Tax=Canis lupus familiaris TaxID=9615 RepID=A0A8C0PSJ2_CANLF